MNANNVTVVVATASILQKQVKGVDFAAVAKMLGGGVTNIPSDETGAVEEFLRGHGLIDVPHIFVSTNSIGGRWWMAVEGRTPAFYKDTFFRGGWNVFVDEDVTFLRLQSASSGSTLTAEKQEDWTWTVTLQVPVGDDGQPYKGCYWNLFHDGVATAV